MKHHDGVLYESRDGEIVEAVVAPNAMDLSTPDGRFQVYPGDYLIVRGHYEIGMARDTFLERYREPGSWPKEAPLDLVAVSAIADARTAANDTDPVEPAAAPVKAAPKRAAED